MSKVFTLLALGAAPEALDVSAWGPFDIVRCNRIDDAAAKLREQAFDAVWIALGSEADAGRLAHWSALTHAVLDAAVVVTWPDPSSAAALALMQRGVQDVLPHQAASAEALGRALRLGIERKQLERAARKAYATDLATGLPNHAQLLEHMTHLLALREREPAPMALLVLRVEGLATVAADLGEESANVLRRKVAVRLRAGLRASDVVASIGQDSFAVLLAWTDASAAGLRVADKLAQALQQPFQVAGRPVALAVCVGAALYPEHGRDADSLMRRAVGQATSVAPMGRAGFANRVERGPAAAANDEVGPPVEPPPTGW